MGPISTSRKVPYSLSTPQVPGGRVPPPSILVRNCIVKSPLVIRVGRYGGHHIKVREWRETSRMFQGAGVARGCPLSMIQADTAVPPSPPGAATTLCTAPRGVHKLH